MYHQRTDDKWLAKWEEIVRVEKASLTAAQKLKTSLTMECKWNQCTRKVAEEIKFGK